MHRSGTSLIAKILYDIGFDFGDKKRLYPADRWNPTGYYESIDVHSINIPLVHGILGKMSYLFLPSPKSILKRSIPLRSQIKKTSQIYQDKVVKDPRFCLTLNAWLAVSPSPSAIIHCIRHPQEVAGSLFKRNKLPSPISLKLWREHNMRLRSEMKNIPVKRVFYEDLVSKKSCRNHLSEIFSFLEYDVCQTSINNIIENGIRQNLNNNSEYRCAMPKKINDYWQFLRET